MPRPRHEPSQFDLLRERRFAPFFWTQFLGAMNDNVLKFAFTVLVTEWRTHFRRDMNELDSKANVRAIDSLLNYETVKYFGNEGHEVQRFDEAKRRYVDASVANQRSLTIFNIGQAAILSVGVVIVMLLAAYSVAAKRTTIGDFVMVNAYLLQLYGPLNMLGWVYRNLRQSMIDIIEKGRPQYPGPVRHKPGNRIAIQVVPGSGFDKLLYAGMS